jgi:YD repeat-containing protein
VGSEKEPWTNGRNGEGLSQFLVAWNHSYPAPNQLGRTAFQPFVLTETLSLPTIAATLPYSIVSGNADFDFYLLPMPQNGSSKIVFTSNREGNAQIYSMNIDGSALIRLTNNSYNDDHPRWSPNGTKILFQSDRDSTAPDPENPGPTKQDIYVMNVDGSGQTRLTTDAADDCNAEWSPDGSKILFQSLRNGSYYQVYTMNPDSSGQTNLSNGSAADIQPSWSPNGSKIAFASERDHAGIPAIYVMNSNGSNQTRLTFTGEPFKDEQPIWSRDALKIVFVSTRDSVIETWQETDDDGNVIQKSALDSNKEIYLMNADGSNQTRLTNTLENEDAPGWSPDNTKIVFHSDRERDTADPTQQLWTMNVDGTNQSLIAGNEFRDYSPSWSNNIANQSPIANSGGPYSGVIAQNIAFSASGSFDPDGTISSYSWTFGDGGSGSGATPTHSYASTGTYNVTLTVTDNLGAQASATTPANITTAGSEQYLENFNFSALARSPSPNESSYWNDILRAAYSNGQTSMVLAVRELGKSVFESNEYTARNRNNHWYVYDLYKTYLMREPDADGWVFWENYVPQIGREAVRRAFDECGEFAGIVATLTPSGSPSSNVSSLSSARVDPFNQPGNGLASRDADWSVSLLSLPGRAGLDLGLSLSYSSMVWTRSGPDSPYIYFDEDNGWPSPGFHLGFPTIQQKSFDAQAGRNVYLLVSGGNRVSLRQVGTSSVYEAADSSYLQLTDNGGSLLLRTTDGTQLEYQASNTEWRCTKIKDRNGNFITVEYDWLGHIAKVFDTLSRTITFKYDDNVNLLSIEQSWTVQGAQVTHTWASFGWTTQTVAPGFSGIVVVGNPSTIPVLNQVGFDDGTYCKFLYNSGGQVTRITHYASDSNPSNDNHPLNYIAYDYDGASNDCPRVSATRVWAENWTGINGVPAEVTTQYGVEGDAHTAYVVGDPNSTVSKEFYGTGWQRGLTTRTEVWSGGIKQKWITTDWTQDNTAPGISYQTNPRVSETNIYDAGGNRRRTTTNYTSFTLPSGASCPLPVDVREYATDGTTIMRHSHTVYRMDPTADSAYLNRHIIGLAKERTLFEVNGGSETLMSKLGFQYDETGSIQGNASPVQHDSAGYDATLVTGRGNLSSVKRYDVTNSGQWTMSNVQYNTAGGVVKSIDPLGHENSVIYTDSFSDLNNSRNTLAYPTTVTDADGFATSLVYNFDYGAKTRVQGPPPANQTQGLIQTFAYDNAARLELLTTVNNGAYQRYFYGPNYQLTWSTVNNILDEAYSCSVFDGMGRPIVAASNHPVPGRVAYSAVNTIYDQMGRAVKQSNPTETNGAWAPGGDDAGWLYTQQTYDWKGRSLVTTNPDNTTKEASYTGCGCAGGEVTTLTDEGTLDGGVPKRRQQKIYADVLGRTVKTELRNWQGGSSYATTINSYNARDQLTRVRQFDAAQATVPEDPNDLSCPNGSCQQTTMTYDGYGRLKTKHAPEQQVDSSNSASSDHTTWNYNPDDTVQSMIDARGASQTFTYNNRQLVIDISYLAPAGINDTARVSYDYDHAGNRTSMTDGMGSMSYAYDQLSRLTSETRTITNLGTYPLNYTYNLAGAMKSVTDPFGAQIQYNFDSAGRVANVTGSGFGGVSNYTSSTSNIQYRAWGGQKSVTYGDGTSATTTYDARMRPSSYDMPGLREQFQYYDDGRLKQMTDLDDRDDILHPDTARHFSRARSYDQAGRLTSDKGATSSTFPLKQNYAHDAFDNLTSRYGTYYYQNQTSDSATYSNNRRQNWTYYADGQVKHSPLAYDANFNETLYRDWSYDAAGQMVQVQETITNPSSVSTYTTAYDGDGQPIRESTATAANNTTGYMIRSSVLDDVITRLDGTGNKTKTIVNVDGMLTAVQLSISGSNWITWTHVDPLGLSEAGDTKPVYDALGNYVPWQHVPSGPPPNAYPPSSPNFGGLGSGFGSTQSVSCADQGMPINCNTAMRLISNGSATIDSIISNQQSANFFASMGMAFVIEVNTTRTKASSSRPGRPPTPPHLWPKGTRTREPDPGPGGDGEGGSGPTYNDVTTVSYRLVSLGGVQQNPNDSFGARASYETCKSSLAGKVPVPTFENARAVLEAARLEKAGVVALAVTISAESGEWFKGASPSTNGPHGGGTADVGPGQIDYGGLQNSSLFNGLGNVFGSNTGVGDVFNGNVIDNLRATARLIQDMGGGRQGAIHYHSGTGDFLHKPDGQKALQARTKQYDNRAPAYRRFFECLGAPRFPSAF